MGQARGAALPLAIAALDANTLAAFAERDGIVEKRTPGRPVVPTASDAS
jgi:hypothetical protein